MSETQSLPSAFHSPVTWTAQGRTEQDLRGLTVLDRRALSTCGLPVEESHVEGVDLALDVLDSPESFSSRF